MININYMKSEYKEILETIDKIFEMEGYSFSDYIYYQLKEHTSLGIIDRIVNQGNKTPTEAILTFLAAIRFLKNDIDALSKLEERDAFKNYIVENLNEILEISIKRKVQSNGPERGMPILEILGRKMDKGLICVIELGASYGLIGSCLLNYENIQNNGNGYFTPEQKMPENPKCIDHYLGIDIDPPDKNWLLACFFEPYHAKRVKDYIDRYQVNHPKIIKKSAIGFSKLEEVKKLVKNDYTIIILTSFMIYQLNSKQKINLEEEIKAFNKEYNGHWIRQEVEIGKNSDELEFYIEWDEERIIKLRDDKCMDWNWIE